MINFSIRKIEDGEYDILNKMLYEAIFVPKGNQKPEKNIIKLTELAVYTKNWGEDIYDLAFGAVVNGKIIGAIWGRIFTTERKGYGFVNTKTPEISMAIFDSYRGKGIGTRLLENIISEYKKMNVKNISLSVDLSNRAKHLYDKFDFEIHEIKGGSATMLLRL